jgi:hypothetical protein
LVDKLNVTGPILLKVALIKYITIIGCNINYMILDIDSITVILCS